MTAFSRAGFGIRFGFAASGLCLTFFVLGTASADDDATPHAPKPAAQSATSAIRSSEPNGDSIAATTASTAEGDEAKNVTTVIGRREAAAGTSEVALSREKIESLPGGATQPLSYTLATQPGFVTDTFGFGLHVRGADGGLLYVVDGIPLFAAPLGQWGATIGFLPTRLVKSLRLLTGGFPAEYGSGLGAVVDIQTPHAVGKPSGEVQASYGTYNTTNLALDYAQEIGRLSLLVGGSFQSSNRGLDPPSASPIIHDDISSGGGFARLDYLLGDRDRFELITSFNQSRFQLPVDPTLSPLSQAPAGAIRGVDKYGNEPPPFVPYDANPLEIERNVFAALSYVHTSAVGAVQVAPFFREAYGKLSCDSSGSLGSAADPGSSCSDVRRDVFHGGALAKVTRRLGEHQAWKTGVLVDFARSSVGYTAFFRDDANPLGGPDPAQTLSGSDITNVLVAGAFLQDEMQLGKWTILPGARLDIESNSFVGSDEPSLFLVGPSARLGVSYAVNRWLSVHGFAGYLWQPPSTIDAPVAGRILIPALAGQVLPVDIKAEKDWSAELGITSAVLPGVTVGLTGWGRLASDQLDRINVGTTNLVASYNFERGRAVGAEAFCRASVSRYADGFANVGWQVAQGMGITSERFLFTPEDAADKKWVMLDHVQTWTANVGFDLHDASSKTHLSGLLNYGSGMRTGAESDKTVPSHVTLDITLRHRFDVSRYTHPEVAIDVLNLFNDIYAYRIGTGYVGSAYGPLRRVFLRLTIPFGIP